MAKEVAKIPLSVAKRNKLVEQMTPALQKVYEKIQKSWQTSNKSDVLVRYDWGLAISKIRNTPREEVYGEGAVKQLAEALGANPRNLYQYADIADTWTREEVVSLLEQGVENGYQLTFSHFRTLADIADDKLRQLCQDRCLKEAMNNQELEVMVKDKLDARRDKDDPLPTRRVATVLKQFMKQAQGIVAKSDEYDSKLFDPLDNLGTEAIDENFLDTLSLARDLMNELEGVVESAQRRFSVVEQRAATVVKGKAAIKKQKQMKSGVRNEDDEEEVEDEDLEEDLEEEVDEEDADYDEEEVDEDEDEDEDLEEEDEEEDDTPRARRVRRTAN